MRTSGDRLTNYNSFTLTPSVTGQGSLVEGEATLKFITYANTFNSFTLESPNLYLSTSKLLMPHHQVTVGRRKYRWSEVDEIWKLGVWTPRFTWEPYRPDNIGLTGAFYTYESKAFRMTVYGTPLSIPERGAPIVKDAESGSLAYTSPWQQPLPTQIEVSAGKLADTRYYLRLPSMSQILFRPASAVSVEYGEKTGFWSRSNIGFMAIHPQDLAVDGGITATTTLADLNIHPYFPMQRIGTAEIGYRGSYFSLWASGTRQDPVRKSVPPSYLFNKMEDATIASAGASLSAQGDLTLSGSYLAVFEDADTAVRDAEATNVKVPLDSRFLYRRAFQLSARWGHDESRLLYNVQWINDIENKNHWISLDVNFSPWAHKAGKAKIPLSFGIGADFFSASTKTGTLGKYAGDDQLRGRVSYVF